MKKLVAVLLVCGVFSQTFPSNFSCLSRDANVIGKEIMSKCYGTGKKVKVTEKGIECDNHAYKWSSIDRIFILDYQGEGAYQLLLLKHRNSEHTSNSTSRLKSCYSIVPTARLDTIILIEPQTGIDGESIAGLCSAFVTYKNISSKKVIDWRDFSTILTQSAPVTAEVVNLYKTHLIEGYQVVEIKLITRIEESGKKLAVEHFFVTLSSIRKCLSEEREGQLYLGLLEYISNKTGT